MSSLNDDVMHENPPSCRHRVGIPPPTWEFDSAEHKRSRLTRFRTLRPRNARLVFCTSLFVSFGDPKSSRSSKSSRSQTRDPKMATLDPKTVRLVPKTGLNPFRICVLPSKTAADARTNGRTHMKNLRHSHNRPFGQKPHK